MHTCKHTHTYIYQRREKNSKFKVQCDNEWRISWIIYSAIEILLASCFFHSCIRSSVHLMCKMYGNKHCRAISSGLHVKNTEKTLICWFIFHLTVSNAACTNTYYTPEYIIMQTFVQLWIEIRRKKEAIFQFFHPLIWDCKTFSFLLDRKNSQEK